MVGATGDGIIGNHVKLCQGVDLVVRSLAAGQALRGRNRHPTLEDRVTVFAGATIIGGDTVVGAGSTIGATVFLASSVPANLLAGLEATNVRIIPKHSRESDGLDYQICTSSRWLCFAGPQRKAAEWPPPANPSLA